MIRGLHGLLYSSDSDATRAFMRDALKLPFSDVGGGWLIFDLPEADLGVHPIDEPGSPPANTHSLSFYCDDIQSTVAELKSRGVQFKADPADHGYGYVTYFTMPGGVEVQLYEPKYEKAKPKPPAAKARPAAPARKAAARRSAKPAPKAKPTASSKTKPKARASARASNRPRKR